MSVFVPRPAGETSYCRHSRAGGNLFGAFSNGWFKSGFLYFDQDSRLHRGSVADLRKLMTSAGSRVGGVHHDVGSLGRGKLCFWGCLFEMAQDGLAAASVGGGKLCGGLFACGVGLP